jgi:hypothetical protein
MSHTLVEVFKGQARFDYTPISPAAVRRILAFDRERGFGPGGTEPNRNRFYHWLVQNGSDVQIRTVAVKAKRKNKEPLVKEVARASVDDPWIHVHDLGFYTIGGYFVDWSPEGFGYNRGFNYGRRWETSAYALRCMWKINATVVNPELLKRTRRFRWSAWDPERGHLLDYLKIYKEHPEIELLSKSGLGRFCTKIAIVRKLKADRNFRQFFMKHVDVIRDRWSINAPVILKAYSKGLSFGDACKEIETRQMFRGCDLPRSICPVKAYRYICKHKLSVCVYTDYLHNSQKLGFDLVDTKVSFPRQFKARQQAVQDRVDAIRRAENAEKIAEMNRQLEAIADKWSWVERKSGDYRVVVPRTEEAFIVEGKALVNCLGDYAAKVARGECVVVFVSQSRRPNKAYVAASYDPKTGVVSQCYGKNNSTPPKEVRKFVERVFSKAKVQLKVAA